MNAREKLSAFFILPGMLLLCTDYIPAAIAGTALLGAGAVVLNWEEVRRAICQSGRLRPRGATCLRQPEPNAGKAAAANWQRGHRAKKPR